MEEKKEWKAPATIETLYAATGGNAFAGTNSPKAGARTEKALEVGDAPYQLYSLATPNGMKVNILLEELGVKYDPHTIKISGDQFTSGFVGVNPNSKIPALVDNSDAKNPIRLFESGSILLYLADKHKKFVPGWDQPAARADVINWLMWQMGSAPYLGQFGHFFKYAPKTKIEAIEYGVARYGMETQRLVSVMNMVLAHSTSGYISNWGYSIADMAIYPWFFCIGKYYNAWEFLSLEQNEHVVAWMKKMEAKPAVQKAPTITGFS